MSIEVRDETLVFLERDGKIALGLKTRKTAEGYRNGPGGKRQKNEGFFECAARETKEEFGVEVSESDLDPVALLTVTHISKEEKFTVVRLLILSAKEFQGDPKETEELRNPRWYDKMKLPYGEMMATDRIWLAPIFEHGKKVLVNFQLDSNKKLVGVPWIKFVEKLEKMHLRKLGIM